ncbi:MAG: ComEC/Rec2 family competence protein [Elusimicrobia bacterium]|nr:ComEC/Rec2 family competence protein [Elusimicrobiota bacterium]
MPLSYLKRPVFMATVLYMLVLVFLHWRGSFSADPPKDMGSLRNRYGALVVAVVASPLTENRLGEKVYLRAEEVSSLPFEQEVLAYLPKAGPFNKSLRPGMKVRLEGRLRLPRRPRNPGEYDEKGFLDDRGVGWIMRARTLSIVSSRVPWHWTLRAWAEAGRRRVQDRFEASLGPEEARIMTGLCLGFKGPLRRELNRAVQDAGVMHLLVPSGAKVAFVILVAEWLGAWFLPPLGRFAAAGAVGGYYTLMVGADAPYARACLAWLALRGAGLLGREPGSFQAIALSALLILGLRPRDLFAVGFQMTYLAVSGLVLAMPQLNKVVPDRWPGWLKGSVQVLAVSVIVQVMLWPTFAAYFGRGAVVGVFANILLVPVSGVMMGGGFLLALAGDGPWGAFAWAAAVGARLFVRACFWFASLPGAAVDLAPMSQVETAVYYLLLLGVLALPRWRASGVLVSLGLILWGGTALAGALEPRTRVRFVCLPKGRAALVRFPDGRRWLVDAGGPAGTVLRVMKDERVRRLDRVVVTGLGRERWGGLERVLAEVPVGSVTVPAGEAPPRLGRCLDGARAMGIVVEADPAAPGFVVAAGRIRFDFSGELPAVRRGEAEYSIIGPRLRWRSIEVTTDGEKAEIHIPN